MRLTTKFIICIVLINQVACNLVDKGTLEKVEYLRNLKQTWEDNKDQFPEIQTQLSQAQIVWGVPLQAYDPSIKSSGHEMVLVTTKDSQAISHTNDSTGIYKAIFKSRGFLHQKVEQGAFNISLYLHMQGLIPPTVRYNHAEKKRSTQLLC